jgi:hypothetical protein
MRIEVVGDPFCIHPVVAAGMTFSELTGPPRQAARATGNALRQFL